MAHELLAETVAVKRAEVVLSFSIHHRIKQAAMWVCEKQVNSKKLESEQRVSPGVK